MVVIPSSTIYSGETVVVSYDQSAAGADAIGDPAGNKVAVFTTGSGDVPDVTNNSNETYSMDATLSGLTVTGGGSDLVTFVSGTTDYAASVKNAVAEVTVTPTPNDSDATIEYLDEDDATLTDTDNGEGRLPGALDVGDTVIKVKVRPRTATPPRPTR